MDFPSQWDMILIRTSKDLCDRTIKKMGYLSHSGISISGSDDHIYYHDKYKPH